MKKRPKLARSLSGTRSKNAAQMALIGKTGFTGYDRQVGPACSQRPAGELHTQTIHEFGQRAAGVLAKNARNMNGTRSYLAARFLERQRFSVRFVQQFERAIQPRRTLCFLINA